MPTSVCIHGLVAVLLFSKGNKLFLGYFKLINFTTHNKDKKKSGWPDGYFGSNINTGLLQPLYPCMQCACLRWNDIFVINIWLLIQLRDLQVSFIFYELSSSSIGHCDQLLVSQAMPYCRSLFNFTKFQLSPDTPHYWHWGGALFRCYT